MKTTMTYYIDKDGTLILAASQYQTAVIDLLAKLGLKSAPENKMWTFTVPATQWYTYASTTSDGSTITFNGVLTTGTDIAIAEPPEVVKVKGFSRGEKKNWRDKWKNHSKNTGHRR